MLRRRIEPSRRRVDVAKDFGVQRGTLADLRVHPRYAKQRVGRRDKRDGAARSERL